MAKNTSDVVKNLKGQGQEYYSNKPMEKGGTIKLGSRSKFKAGAGKDFKTPQWMKDIGEGVEFVGDKIGEAFPKKGWTEVNTQQAVLGGLPLLAGLAFGGTRGAAIGGQVGLKALEDIRKGREDAFDRNVELKKLQLQEQGQKERLRYLEAQLGLRERGLDVKSPLTEAQTELTKAKTEKVRKETTQTGKGKKLPPAAVKLLAEGNALPKMMDDLEQVILSNKDLFNPFGGGLRSFNPWDTRVQAVNADLKSKAQVIGLYLEGGKLMKADEEKYLKMLPRLGDTPDTAYNKMEIVRKLIRDKQAEYLKGYQGQGYDMSGVAGTMERAPIPQALGGKPKMDPKRVEALMKRDNINRAEAERRLMKYDARKKGGK